MGKISSEIKKNINLNKKIIDITTIRKVKDIILNLNESLNSISSDEFPPLFQTLGLISECLYGLSNLKALRPFKKISMSQNDLYMPSYPPMSPLTDSYYNMWELFDLRFGKDQETLGSIFLELVDELKLHPDIVKLAKVFNESRMGIYEVIHKKGNIFLLKELLTNKIFKCYCLAGYQGKIGQIWYVRLFSPPYGEQNASAITTTPYILINEHKTEWNDFFKRNNVSEENLHNFMKFGPSMYFWNEYIFYGYFNFHDKAIFLSGIPDCLNTLPCHNTFNNSKRLEIAAHILLRKDDFKKIQLNLERKPIEDSFDKKDSKNLSTILKGRKASEVFLDYASSLIEEFSTQDDLDTSYLEQSLRIPWMVWNSCVFDQAGKMPVSMMENLKKEAPKDKKIQRIIRYFEERKKTEFKKYEYLMGEFQIIPVDKNNFNLRMEARQI